MTKPKPTAAIPSTLRQRAETELENRSPQSDAIPVDFDMLKLIHELEVHQIELKMQNEELLKALADAQDAIKLYDFAPTGYFTLSRESKILKLNICAAQILGKGRDLLLNNRFDSFVSDDSRPVFNLFLETLSLTKNTGSCRLTMINNGTAALQVHVTGIVNETRDQCLITVTDITSYQLAKQQLSLNDARLDLAMHAAGMAWWDMDITTGSVSSCTRKAEMLGYPPEKFTHYTDFTNLLHPDDVDKVFDAMRRHFAGEIGKFEVEYRLLAHSGEYVWFFDSGSVVKRDASGNPLRFSGLVIDITERKKTEEAINASETRYRRLFETSKDGILILDAYTGKITNVNPFLIQLLGFTREQFVEKEIWEIGFFKDIAANKDKFAELQQQQYVRYENLPLETADGQRINVEFVSNVYLDGQNKVIQCNIRDITDRFVMEVALRESEGKYRYMFANNPQPMWIFDVETLAFLEVNQAAIDHYGYTKAEFMGMTLLDIRPHDDIPILRSHLKHAGDLLNKVEMVRHVRKDGELIDVDITYHSFIYNGRLARHVLINDVTESRRAFSLLSEREQFIESLLNLSPQIVYIYDIIEQKIIYSNNGIQTCLAYTDAQIEEMGEHVVSFIMHPSDFKNYLDESSRVYSNATDSEHFLRQVRLKHKCGEWKWFDCSETIYKRETDGSPLQIFGVAHDISIIKQAKDELRFTMDQLSEAQEIGNIGSFSYDFATGMHTTSPQLDRIFGFKPHQVKDAMAWRELLHPDDRAAMEKAVSECAEHGIPYGQDYRIVRDGQVFWLHGIGKVELDADGKVVIFNGVNIDITQRKLSETTQRLTKFAFDHSVDSIIWSLPNGRIVDVNEGTLSMLGFTREEMLQLSISDIDSAYSKEVWPLHFAELRMKGSLCFETIQRTKAGRLIDVAITANYLVFEGAEFNCSFIRDITERKQQGALLQESETRFKQLFESNNAIMLLIEPETGLILDANDAAAQFYGYSISMLRSMKISDINTLPEEQITKNLDKAINQNLNFFIFQHKLANGCDRTVEVHSSPIAFQGQHLLFLIIHDITERVQVEKALVESESRAHAILAATPDLLFILNREGVFLDYKAATKDLLYQTQSIIGQKSHDVLPPVFAGLLDGKISLALHTGQMQLFEYEMDLPGKGIREYEARMVPNGTDSVIAIVRDITQRKHAELEIQNKNAELQKSNAEKDKFFSIIAHDLRSPFNGFLGLTQLMSESLPGMTLSEIQQMARQMRKSATNLFSLLGNLLEWSRMQRGLITFVPHPFLLWAEIEANMVLIAAAATAKQLSVTYDVPADLKVVADENMVGGIIRNLMNNAVKFTPKGGNIAVSAKQVPDNSIQVCISDTGIGMQKDLLDDLFHIDANTGRKGTEGEASTGLGLFICKDFVEIHGGKLWAESQPDKGSTFYFTLPGVENAIENLASSAPEIKPAKLLEVLIAEDDETSELIMTLIVKPISYSILKVHNGLDAVEACRNNPGIDLVLMDIKMPVMDGYEAARQIRLFNKDIIIVAQTAYGEHSDVRKSIASGCNDHISKPINQDKMLALIHKYF